MGKKNGDTGKGENPSLCAAWNANDDMKERVAHDYGQGVKGNVLCVSCEESYKNVLYISCFLYKIPFYSPENNHCGEVLIGAGDETGGVGDGNRKRCSDTQGKGMCANTGLQS